MRKLSLLVVVAAGWALGACRATGAGEPAYDPRPYIEECDRAAVRAAGPADELATYAAAYHIARSCRDYPNPDLGLLWAAVPPDTAALRQLGSATGWRGEGPELLHALVGVAADSARPAAVRISALASLMGYFRPGEFGFSASLRDTTRTIIGSISHPSYRASSSVLPAAKDSARRVLRAAWAREGDRTTWHAYRIFLRSSDRGIDRWNAEDRRRCRAHADSAENDPLFLSGESARGVQGLGGCTSAGPGIFARAWRVVDDDSAQLRNLLWVSQTIRDQRTLDAVLQVSRDRTRPLAVRFAAMHTAATLVDPAMYSMGPTTWTRDPETCYSWWGWHHHHAVQEDGEHPLGADARDVVRAELDEVARSADERQVRQLAGLLARCIR